MCRKCQEIVKGAENISARSRLIENIVRFVTAAQDWAMQAEREDAMELEGWKFRTRIVQVSSRTQYKLVIEPPNDLAQTLLRHMFCIPIPAQQTATVPLSFFGTLTVSAHYSKVPWAAWSSLPPYVKRGVLHGVKYWLDLQSSPLDELEV